MPPVRATHTAHLIIYLLDLIGVFSEGYALRNSSFCYFLSLLR